jgi:hypothetical protein
MKTELATQLPGLALTGATTAGNRARQWNRWRERYNPLRGLNIARCVTLLEQYQRGEMADPQWVYFFIEQSDADLFAILERREAAILQLDWDIKLVSERGRGREMGVGESDARRQDFDEGLAAEQASALREAYEGIDNLYEAISHLQLATFRGFAHCEKYRNADGDIYHLELVDQWNVVRDLLRGRWKYNPDALSTTFDGISDDNLIDPADFLIRERDRHVNRLALLKFIRTNLSEKDWDAFIEIYGIPSGVVIGPAGVPSDKENEYKTAAQAIAEGGSGYLPNGSDYKPNTLPGGTAPFRPRLDFLTEKLVLAGTGGLLTMLAQSGSGTLAGGAHQDAFETIARAEARKISELLQRQLDREIIEHHFPGCAVLAYFELAAHEPLDPGTIADHAQRFAAAGYRIDLAQLAEKSGYKLTDMQAEADEEEAGGDMENGDGNDERDDRQREEEGVKVEDPHLLPIINRLVEFHALPAAEFAAQLPSFLEDELPGLCTDLVTNRAVAQELTEELSELLLNSEFEEEEHPRQPAGSESGGQFIAKAAGVLGVVLAGALALRGLRGLRGKRLGLRGINTPGGVRKVTSSHPGGAARRSTSLPGDAGTKRPSVPPRAGRGKTPSRDAKLSGRKGAAIKKLRTMPGGLNKASAAVPIRSNGKVIGSMPRRATKPRGPEFDGSEDDPWRQKIPEAIRKKHARAVRNEEILTEEQRSQIFRHVKELGLRPRDFKINSHMSDYSDHYRVAFLGPNCFPLPPEQRVVRSVFARMEPRAVVAHETGHLLAARHGRGFKAGSLAEEVQASLLARLLPGLNSTERYQLLRDAAERARKSGTKLSELLRKMYRED